MPIGGATKLTALGNPQPLCGLGSFRRQRFDDVIEKAIKRAQFLCADPLLDPGIDLLGLGRNHIEQCPTPCGNGNNRSKSWFEEGSEFPGVALREPVLQAQPIVAR